MFSVICACNNKQVLDNMVVKSLERQTYQNYELIVVDAKLHGFKSAAETLNYGASLARGDVLLFVHQDVELISDTFLEKAHEFCSNVEFDIAGVCGIVDTGEYKVYSSVTMGNTHIQAGRKITAIREIYALDECLFFIKKDRFKGFDDFGPTWHFYAVEYCIRVNNSGGKTLLFPLEIYHLSPGWSLDYSYFDTLQLVGRKYAELPKIMTCMGVFTNGNTLHTYCIYRKLKLWIKKVIGYQKRDYLK